MTGSWSIDPDTRRAMRLNRVRQAFASGDWTECMLEAEELLDEVPDSIEALALLGQAALQTGDAQIGALALEQAIGLADAPDVDLLVGLAVARFEMCQLVACAEVAREAVRIAPDRAEAHWYLGLSLERLEGHQAEAMAELAAARQLEPDTYPWPLAIAAEEWEGLIHAALADLHPNVRAFWNGLPVMVLEEPDLDELRAMDPPVSPAVSGLYLGSVPEDGDVADARPEGMRLFQRNLAICRDRDEVVDQIALALEAEALGWAGAASLDEL